MLASHVKGGKRTIHRSLAMRTLRAIPVLAIRLHRRPYMIELVQLWILSKY